MIFTLSLAPTVGVEGYTDSKPSRFDLSMILEISRDLELPTPFSFLARTCLTRSHVARFLFMIALIHASNAEAQRNEPESVVLAGGASCRSCRLQRQEIARIGNSSDGLDYPVAAVRVRGEYIISFETSPVPFRFRPTGELVGPIAREGSGPGEFKRARDMVTGPNDSVYVYDSGNRRISVLSPSFRIVRSFPSLGFYTMLPIGGKKLLVNAPSRQAATAGNMFHVVDTDGNPVASFGGLRSQRPGDEMALARHLVPHPPNRFISVRWTQQYEIEVWTSSGQRAQRFHRSVPWFLPYTGIWAPTPSRAPPPFVVGSWQDTRDRVWILTRVADPEWRRALAELPPAEGQKRYSMTNQHSGYDTMVEVLDLRAQRVVLSERIDERVSLVLAPGVIGILHENEDGSLRLSVNELSLRE